ncbi:MAG: Pycsar system effector family protein [Bacteroidota bacterium]
MQITQQAQTFVESLLTEKLGPNYTYHNLEHTISVRDNCLKLGRMLELDQQDLEILELAALFHDTGFINRYKDHETESIFIAKKFLQEQDYPIEYRAQVLACIDATRNDREPTNLMERIIIDADLGNLGNTNYPKNLQKLRNEWEKVLGNNYEDEEWYLLNHRFLEQHEYRTKAAKKLFNDNQKKNKKAMKAMAKKKKKEAEDLSLNGNKTAQVMFKTSLRNHIDLSNLADNKANIMLSVNALIITIAMPFAASYISTNPYLLFPMITLAITCMASMVFATLATRPIQMTGYTDEQQIAEGRSNLFFFGNFYQMDFKSYKDGLQRVIADDSHLDESIMRDLYFLGSSLGTKYNQLRVCYNIFMFGIIVTVIIFVGTYWVHHS